VTDWITFQICWAELAAVYLAVRTGAPWPLPPLPVQYSDYALWEREWFQGPVLEEYAEFWRRELAGYPLELTLPTDRPRPAVQSQRGGMYRVRAGIPRTERLRSVAQAEKATYFMAVLAVVAAHMGRLTGWEKLVVGSNSANRARPELEPVVGFFLTQVPFAFDLGGDPTFRELLQQSRKRVIAAYSHQNFPFTQMLAALGLPDTRRHYPLVQSLLLLLQGESSNPVGDLLFQPVELFDGNSRWDLNFGLYDYKEVGLSGVLEYNADLFDAATIGRWLELFYRLMDAAGENPDLRLSQLPTLGEVERGQALVEWGGASSPGERLIEELARAHRAGDPAATLAVGSSTLPWAEVAARAATLGGALHRLGVGAGQKVGVVLPPSLDLAGAVLAVWQLGGVAVPVDPASTADHLVALLADAELAALVYRDVPSGLLPASAARLDLERFAAG
jgi:non-ribosomal peptide synthetase component F